MPLVLLFRPAQSELALTRKNGGFAYYSSRNAGLFANKPVIIPE
ncbi:hypothetical protein DDI_0053 [Dickeya dianthicola RNS04.9]|nr:hypothetical protein DDI_0053 [Dickeya dianthicola RNS04.9]